MDMNMVVFALYLNIYYNDLSQDEMPEASFVYCVAQEYSKRREYDRAMEYLELLSSVDDKNKRILSLKEHVQSQMNKK
ncbi:hypothetical protein DdX_00286 [Ditylenchus destructor]|uniref:Tetratricopeptide repeat protein n=1 Tax=Ditylenchus destructor TaxID=166010 RepID=A0AAD4NG86_9BILA|nr:hypothetical protein DdX_00286 [Ditylenchus destructor]